MEEVTKITKLIRESVPTDKTEWIYVDTIYDKKLNIGFITFMYILFPLVAIPYLLDTIDKYFTKMIIVFWNKDYNIEVTDVADGSVKTISGTQLVSSITDTKDSRYINIYKSIARRQIKHFIIALGVNIVIYAVLYSILFCK